MNRPVFTPLPAQAVDALTSETHKQGTIFPLLSRAAATYTSDAIHNPDALGVRLFIDITDKGVSGTVTAKIQNQDPVSGSWVDLTGAVTSALAANGVTALTLYPGLTAAANDKIDGHLGMTWRVSVTVAANAVIFAINGVYLT
jgi:hypothetical protein